MKALYPGVGIALDALKLHKASTRSQSARAIHSTPNKRIARDAQTDIDQIRQVLNLSSERALSAMVYMRVWLHNLLVTTEFRGGPRTHAVRAVEYYAEWLDGIPQVRSRLPSSVIDDSLEAAIAKRPRLTPIKSTYSQLKCVGSRHGVKAFSVASVDQPIFIRRRVRYGSGPAAQGRR